MPGKHPEAVRTELDPFYDLAERIKQLDIHISADVGRPAVGSIHKMGAKPDSLSGEIGSLVCLNVYFLLRE